MHGYDTPILLIVFNRPDATSQVFEAIRRVRPKRLFIAADGPRPGSPTDAERCARTRDVVRRVDWPCAVTTLFREVNVGCKHGPASAITWFFENVEEGIVLEDDCVPEAAFFSYCRELLSRYRDDPRVMHVSGTTFVPPSCVSNPERSYRFSRCLHVWGWATWRRAWASYDIEMTNLRSLATRYRLFERKAHLRYWIRHFEWMDRIGLDAWDGQWQYTLLNSDGRAITPTRNLIRNIGFGEDATHTKDRPRKTLETTAWLDEIRHPDTVSIDRQADEYLMTQLIDGNLWASAPPWRRWIRRTRAVLEDVFVP